MVPRRNNFEMVRLLTPKRVRLPKERTFLAEYERRKGSYLPANVTVRRRYEKRATRGRQGGQGMQRG